MKELDPRHCDEYIDDPTTPPVLRKYLEFFRSPAIEQMSRRKKGIKEPVCYATVRGDLDTSFVKHITNWGVLPATRVRLVMASRLGDVGITDQLHADRGYKVRVPVEWLKDFSETP